ncbi:MAG TPA: tyrosine-type recombinase/integrase [Vicinamibacteria bacterium]|nr:tyrosine-type recombinase/integrase [Vicinamibacteria bacterium]
MRAKRPTRLPLLLTRREVDAVLIHFDGAKGLMARLLYGSGLRLLECCRLRVKDVDLERRDLLVRNGKGEKDLVTMLPNRLVAPRANQIRRARSLHNHDLKWEARFVELPSALAQKYPNPPREWGWQWVFPAARTYCHRLNKGGRGVRSPLDQ